MCPTKVPGGPYQGYQNLLETTRARKMATRTLVVLFLLAIACISLVLALVFSPMFK